MPSEKSVEQGRPIDYISHQATLHGIRFTDANYAHEPMDTIGLERLHEIVQAVLLELQPSGKESRLGENLMTPDDFQSRVWFLKVLMVQILRSSVNSDQTLNGYESAVINPLIWEATAQSRARSILEIASEEPWMVFGGLTNEQSEDLTYLIVALAIQIPDLHGEIKVQIQKLVMYCMGRVHAELRMAHVFTSLMQKAKLGKI